MFKIEYNHLPFKFDFQFYERYHRLHSTLPIITCLQRHIETIKNYCMKKFAPLSFEINKLNLKLILLVVI